MPETPRETRHRPVPGWELGECFGRLSCRIPEVWRGTWPSLLTLSQGERETEPRIESPKAGGETPRFARGRSADRAADGASAPIRWSGVLAAFSSGPKIAGRADGPAFIDPEAEYRHTRETLSQEASRPCKLPPLLLVVSRVARSARVRYDRNQPRSVRVDGHRHTSQD